MCTGLATGPSGGARATHRLHGNRRHSPRNASASGKRCGRLHRCGHGRFLHGSHLPAIQGIRELPFDITYNSLLTGRLGAGGPGGTPNASASRSIRPKAFRVGHRAFNLVPYAMQYGVVTDELPPEPVGSQIGEAVSGHRTVSGKGPRVSIYKKKKGGLWGLIVLSIAALVVVSSILKA